MNSIEENIVEQNFLKHFQNSTGSGNGTMTALREEAVHQFTQLGFPTKKHEEWKYVNLAPIIKGEYQPFQGNAFRLKREEIASYQLAGKNAITLVFENGRVNKNLSTFENLPAGIFVAGLSDHLSHPLVKENLGRFAPSGQESFVALNTAFINDGALLIADPGTTCDRTIHLIYVNDSREVPVVVYPRNLIIIGKNSKVNIVESYHSTNGMNHGFSDSVTEVLVGENAIVELNKIQLENNQSFHINYTHATQERNSTFNCNTVTLGGAIVRNNINIVLSDVNCTTHLHGLFLLRENELVDNHTLIDHAKPNSFSNELYKGILDGHAQGVFNGKVFVRKDAQKTNAYQSNKNILLSDTATMNVKPQLEIFADDVKCSHGATTGQLDDEALFYLRSRGIGEQDAKAFLNIAFAAEVINKISIEPLRDRLMQLVDEKLKKGN